MVGDGNGVPIGIIGSNNSGIDMYSPKWGCPKYSRKELIMNKAYGSRAFRNWLSSFSRFTNDQFRLIFDAQRIEMFFFD
jgi:hypothetical protein